MSRKPPSLKRSLIFQPLLFQFVTVVIIFLIGLIALTQMNSGAVFTDETIPGVIAGSIQRTGDGRLTVRSTPALKQLRADAPSLWFVAEDDSGRNVSYGQVPREYASLAGTLHRLTNVQLRDRSAPYRLSAVIRSEDSRAGSLTILAHGKFTLLSFLILAASNAISIVIILLLALISMIVTPWIVNRSLAGVNRIAEEARQIDADRRGWRLSEAKVPREILPLVRAVNDVLHRLDEGYERQRRFIASAAHELRTPIAILSLKIDAADDAATRRLGSDVQRLATLAEQLLDFQRLDAVGVEGAVDLASLVKHVAAELAPLLIAADRTIEVVVDTAWPIRGDAGAIERVVTNLVQNAIDHGGRQVVIRVVGAAFEVEDDGLGIPPDERERVFEPFHRLRPRSTGTGLGLHLVQQVIERHGGRVSIFDAMAGGTVVRVEFPPR
ncbi:HAMP domain-containing sensor histidine kinase [Sphingomonas sp. RB3P16]|uniref:sensor histidine kinase n=1 Tax=Parasphingomonas frigoris TaxID=3096163 RepID=UPI002FC81D0F